MSTNNQEPITQNSGGASEWLKQISLTAGPIKSITHIWVVTRHHAWNFCARFSDVILRGNQWWPTSSPGRFSLALEVGGKSALGTRLQWWHHEMSAVFDGYLRKCCLPINTYLYSLNRELSVCLYPEIKLFAQFPSFIQ